MGVRRVLGSRPFFPLFFLSATRPHPRFPRQHRERVRTCTLLEYHGRRWRVRLRLRTTTTLPASLASYSSTYTHVHQAAVARDGRAVAKSRPHTSNRHKEVQRLTNLGHAVTKGSRTGKFVNSLATPRRCSIDLAGTPTVKSDEIACPLFTVIVCVRHLPVLEYSSTRQSPCILQ